MNSTIGTVAVTAAPLPCKGEAWMIFWSTQVGQYTQHYARMKVGRSNFVQKPFASHEEATAFFYSVVKEECLRQELS